MDKCSIATDKEMKKKKKEKKKRGAYDYRLDSRKEILVIIWNDNSCVRLLSNQ